MVVHASNILDTSIADKADVVPMMSQLDEVVLKESWNKVSGNKASYLKMQVFAVDIRL